MKTQQFLVHYITLMLINCLNSHCFMISKSTEHPFVKMLCYFVLNAVIFTLASCVSCNCLTISDDIRSLNIVWRLFTADLVWDLTSPVWSGVCFSVCPHTHVLHISSSLVKRGSTFLILIFLSLWKAILRETFVRNAVGSDESWYMTCCSLISKISTLNM